LPPEPHPRDAVGAGAAARPGLEPAQLELGRLFRLHGRAQSLRRLQLLDRPVGQLQAVRRHGADARFRGGAGAISGAPRGGGEAMTVDEAIRARLARLEPVALELVDESERHRGHAGYREGGNTHWRLSIVSPKFSGKPTVARHRMVYQALGELMQHPIHALAIHARAPEETKGSP